MEPPAAAWASGEIGWSKVESVSIAGTGAPGRAACPE
jgi:hypothetical protein